MDRKETYKKKKSRDIPTSEDSPGGELAPWFKKEISRRSATGRIGKGLAISSVLAMAGISIYKVASSNDDEITLDSLELQKQQGWNVGSTDKPLAFPAGSIKQLDSINQTDWTKFLEPNRLISAVKPSVDQWQPFFVPTLIQGLAQTSLRPQLYPISTPAMTESYNRAQGLGELISQSQNAAETLVIADLPGPESVAVGASLGDKLSVIPAFDNWPHPLGVVHSQETLAALVGYANEIEEKKKSLKANAPGLLLLDNSRLAPYVDADSQFDNRYLAKVPPASELKSRGVKSILYVVPSASQKEELDDLNDEFVDWQKNGIEVRMLSLDEFKPYDEPIASKAPQAGVVGAPVAPVERHYYYGGSPFMHWWFFSNYLYRPYPTVIVTRGGRSVPLSRPPAGFSPSSQPRTASYRPVSRPTMFSASRVGGVYGVGRTRPSGFGRSSVRMSSGRVTGVRAGRSGSWGRSRGWFSG